MNPIHLALPAAFTPDECDAIIALAASGGAPGPVYGAAGYVVDRDRRDVHSVLLARNAMHEGLFARLDALFAQAADTFALPVGPIGEDLQLLRYDVGSHFQAWHSDAGYDAADRRRLSMSVELSERADYDGGELEIVPVSVGRRRSLPRGSAQLFVSRALHRVTPVTCGTRWALVAWAGKPAA